MDPVTAKHQLSQLTSDSITIIRGLALYIRYQFMKNNCNQESQSRLDINCFLIKAWRNSGTLHIHINNK